MFEKHLGHIILSEKAFLSRLREERLRLERSKAPVGLVTIDFSGLIDALGKIKGITHGAVSVHLASTMKEYTRETDLKGWCGPGAIAMLAPNTSEQGARMLAEKLARHLADSLPSNNGLGVSQIKPFFCASALENRCEALMKSCNAANTKTNIKKGQKGKAFQSFRLEFSTPMPFGFHLVPDNQANAMAVSYWPLSLEFMSYTQGKELAFRIKRLIDIVGALFAIAFFSPVMLIIAALIKLTSPCPVLFRQKRLGHMGRPFTFMKFRSMRTDADQNFHKEYVQKLIRGENDEINEGTEDQPVFKITHDPRVTPIGLLLRITSLDELPQFFNVLMGDMSLVGPRPPIPYECDEYKLWHYRRIMEVKPGITGLWQINGRSSLTFDDMVRLDLTYGRTWNLWLDIKILFKTFWAVFSGRGAY
ncbi:MAG: sugar transferase [Deltaproteobacteria bacterium]|nr:sugar transferase [Deltaproteobacteria bacterium]